MPVLAPSTPTTSDGSDTKSHRLQRSLQRTTALTPNAQRTEQSSAARMMAKLESKLAFATLVISGELSGLSTDGLIGEDGRDMFRDSNNLLQWTEDARPAMLCILLEKRTSNCIETRTGSRKNGVENHEVSSLRIRYSESLGKCYRRSRV